MKEPGGAVVVERDDARERLARQFAGITPWDEQEAAHVAEGLDWISSGAPLYRTDAPDVPDPHLVAYTVVVSPSEEILLVDHRKARLWLPSGGHVEPGEDTWQTVERECREELGVAARPTGTAGKSPFFVTATRTRGARSHTDVSLWFLIETDPITSYDEGEFAGIRWLSPAEVLAEPVERLDPHMHRFTGKLVKALG
ncbi:ADP-ribose pyrophosphatase YjhB (NUDIX family) [Nonomuraea fuscirosea]|uniref:ADP-ribose pyrophosphatase YjhB (NUDIX family) n=1 Tax=Nonomuraea fuscirosea TaxID=1291556 RepID=A0A2T0MVT0_9ACTN|nr:NUDIX domain-containing protein [Nonomuraea fuscirosea]PRX63050.1 ADP-ribose pyrophosphatase YjhB (NUDIX family) [Nonomuraea fuscirosea]